MRIQFFLHMVVPTKTYQSGKRVTVKNNRPYFYEDRELQELRLQFMRMLEPHKPAAKFGAGVMLSVMYCFKCKSGTYDGQPKTTKPDTDNLQKLFKDCLTASGFWNDDAQVFVEHVEKYWSNTEGVFVTIEDFNPDRGAWKICY